MRCVVLLLLALFLWPWGLCSADGVYRITGEELTALENNFVLLRQNNEASQKELAELRWKLDLSEKKSEELVTRLGELQTESERMVKSLQSANASLEALSHEEKRKIKRQRNIAYLVALTAIVIAVRK